MSLRAWSERGVLALADSAPTDSAPTDAAVPGTALELEPGLLHLAHELARLAPPADQRGVFLLAAALLAAERAGSTRVPVNAVGALAAALGGERAAVEALLARPAGATLAGLLGGEEDYAPLLRVGDHLYAQRSWRLEGRLGERLRALLASPAVHDAHAVASALADVRARPPLDAGGRPLALSAEQEAAVTLALAGRLAAVTGGPGTGKTWIVAALLRVLARLGDPPLSAVALAAPTGKAADRLHASLRASLLAVGDPAEADRVLLAALPAPLTLHRLLSYSPSGERFRHHERNPLGERLVIVDEGSMLDLALADHLLRSLPAGAALVLLGDAQQLPSVEAGAVFRDVVESAAARPRVARLTRSWRMDAADAAGSAILALAARVAANQLGDLTAVVTARRDAGELAFTGVEHLATPPRLLPAFLDRWWRELVAALPDYLALATRTWLAPGEQLGEDEAARLLPLFRQLEARRLLAPTRGWADGLGVAALNAWFRAALATAAELPSWAAPAEGEPLPGEPVLVTRNDYRRGLYNGDQGVVLRVATSGHATSCAAFRSADGFRVVPLAALAGHLEPAWATTVHKAQGSEHDGVALVLPAEPHPLLSRELLYTAVTRARRSVVLVGSEGVLRAAAARSAERWSGLGERLGAAAPAATTRRRGEQLGLPFE